MISIYNAGPLDNEAEKRQRFIEEQLMIEMLNKYEVEYDIFNPSTSGIVFDEGFEAPTTDQIWNIDYEAINCSNVFFFDLSTDDEGTMVELGIVIEKKRRGDDVLIIPVISDGQVKAAHTFREFDIPTGWNTFMIGAVKNNSEGIHYSFVEGLKYLEEKIKNGEF